ncbi:MAG TPA: PHP domain-containing protein [Lacisediminihabitans sp.]|uniref:PHP domain-containing protein n=1 Tax=Lacisediminihabitans sp. TaxID=2787631 RepID=UPI002ED7DB82
MRRVLQEDHHVHSVFSDDAVSTLAENITAAAAAGLTVVRLVEHVRASTDWVPDFVAAVAAASVPAGLTVLTGVEAKILDTAGHLDLPALPDGIDSIVMADHQFPGPDGPWSPSTTRARLEDGFPVEHALDLLTEGLIGAMHRFPGNQLAHCFSILPKTGLSEQQLGGERLGAWARAAAQTHTIIEVNEKWACPGPEALRAARSAGARLVASTDSHDARDVGRYDRVARILDTADDGTVRA